MILKPLDDAIRDGNTIRAIIRGSGANQDGHTPAMPVPCGKAQEALIRSTYHNAGLQTSETGFVEAHATGTKVGDLTEVRALLRTFGEGRSRRLFIGSVKSTIGHLEGAAGIAGVIKCILAVEKGIIPPNFGFNEWNPGVKPDERIMMVCSFRHLMSNEG
jgi:acyl transferase domain-containing protein